jgi:zinc/manganese transport system ATP-binding protein
MTNIFLSENLTISYGKNTIVQNLSFTVPSGTIVSVMGPNGGGKTTFLKALVGLTPHVSGKWGWKKGESVIPLSTGDIAYLPQGFDVNLSFPLTVGQMVGMALKKFSKGQVFQALEKVTLAQYMTKPLSHLSGGQIRRAFFARTLLQEAPLIFLDEPFAGLDQEATENLLSIVQEWSEQGKIIFLAHHNQARALAHFPLTLLLSSPTHLWGPTKDVLSHGPWESQNAPHPLCC